MLKSLAAEGKSSGDSLHRVHVEIGVSREESAPHQKVTGKSHQSRLPAQVDSVQIG
jgi:hypothetical protein